MQIQVEDNRNCAGSEQFVFNEMAAPRRILGIRVTERGEEVDCDVVGVDAAGNFVEAYAVMINDSGEGKGYLIYGAEWGIRLKLAKYRSKPWDLSGQDQWGEAFKIYGSEEDIIYA